MSHHSSVLDWIRSWACVVSIVAGMYAKWPGSWSFSTRRVKKLFFKIPIPFLGPTQSPIRWVQGIKWQGHKTDHLLHLELKLRVHTALSPLPHGVHKDNFTFAYLTESIYVFCFIFILAAVDGLWWGQKILQCSWNKSDKDTMLLLIFVYTEVMERRSTDPLHNCIKIFCFHF